MLSGEGEEDERDSPFAVNGQAAVALEAHLLVAATDVLAFALVAALVLLLAALVRDCEKGGVRSVAGLKTRYERTRDSPKMRAMFQAMTGAWSRCSPSWKRRGRGATIDSSARTYSAAPPYPQTAVADPDERVSSHGRPRGNKKALTGNMIALAHLAVSALGGLDDLTDDGLARRDGHVDADETVAAEDLVAARSRS
jgi:hypothetical protein